MDDVAVLLARDFGIRQQGKSAPMSAAAAGGSARSSAPAPPPSQSRSGWQPNDSLLGGSDDIFAALSLDSNPSTNGHAASSSPPSFDSIFDPFKDSGPKTSSFYVDDIFGGGIPDMKSTPPPPNYTASAPYDDLLDNFGMTMTPGPRKSIGKRSGGPKDQDLFGFNEVTSTPNQSYNDLLDNLGRTVPAVEEQSDKNELPEFDELIPGFGGSNRPQEVAFPETKPPPSRSTVPKSKRSPEEQDSSGFVELIPGFGRSIPQRSSDPLQSRVTIAPPFIDTTSAHKGRARRQSPRVDPIAIAKARQRAAAEAQQKASQRAAEALAEKIERDMEAQWEQEERRRIAAAQEAEIKRWAAGKEGNLRALLSTLQDVLWPECGWQPVSLVDLITSSSVKKVYRKASLCVHPDKVQQKGATLQHKCIAEKVFDVLKEAWNKFNSEELQRG